MTGGAGSFGDPHRRRKRPGRHPAGPVAVGTLLAAALLAALPAAAFDSKGHNVVKALAYRTLAEGRGGEPPRPDVLRDLLNDGALEPPACFGAAGAPSRPCLDAAEENPLLFWPQPRTDRPDAFFRRQFSDPGQCFHYMATLADAQSGPLPGSGIPRALATRAVVRCNDLLDDLLRQIVVDGGPGVRRSGSGLYELMHAVADSFSFAHTERAGNGDVDYLRVWKPIERLARLPTERTRNVPPAVYHVWDDHRDKTYVTEGEPERCETRTENPYDVTYECLSDEGDRARRALAGLLVVVRELRVAQLSAPYGTDTEPERSPAWQEYRARWFTPVHPCEGSECTERQPADPGPGRYSLLGAFVRANGSSDWVETGARAAVLKFTEAFNPFIYSTYASLGYRRYHGGDGGAVADLGIDLVLPLGFKGSIGFTPAVLRGVFGGSRTGPEFVTRFLRFDTRIGENLFLSFDGPLEVNWLGPSADWSFALGLNWAPESARLAGGPILHRHAERAEQRDPEWAPPPAPYGRLTGRTTSFLVVSGFTVDGEPGAAVERRKYGLGMLGAEWTRDRDAWGGRFAWTPAVHVAAGMRRTDGESAYLTGIVAAEVRWFPVKPLGLSLTPVRLEGGPKVRGKGEADGSPGVHGDPGSENYFRAGSRLGVVLRAGILEFLVEGPTLAWSSEPFAGDEILSVRLGIGLK